MLHKSLTYLLILCYSLPVLLGHGGLHALFGIKHNCSHHCSTSSQSNQVALEGEQFSSKLKLSSHSGCCHHGLEKFDEKEPLHSPSQTPVDEDDCKLCQHTALGQIESAKVEVQASGFVFGTDLPTVLIFEDRFEPQHAPRGPPLFC